MEPLLVINLAATFFMLGLIWFVQIVHYPGFALVGAEHFEKYHALHVTNTTIVVFFPMLIEVVTSALLAFDPTPGFAPVLWLGFALALLIWVATGAMLVPRHNVLARGFAVADHRQLVWLNWTRTIAWTLRGSVMTYVVLQGRMSGTPQ